MLQKLKAFYRKNQNLPLLRKLYDAYAATACFGKNTVAALELLPWRFAKRYADRPIRVCFVQQDPNCWNKSKALYAKLLQDSRFTVHLLCVPDPFDPDTGSTYRFFAENGYDAIDARIGEGPWSTGENKGEWFDLQALEPDYVFYQQPYDAYLPTCYQSKAVSKYAKLCITPYGFALTKELLSCMELDFFRRIYCLYGVSETEKAYNTRRFLPSHKLGIRHSKYLGTLVFSDLLSHKAEQSPSWSFSQGGFRVIWTPRWTTDPKIGGSNFFRYKDFFPEYARKNPGVDLLFRPHPMAFANFVRMGQMTQQEVDDYIALIESGKNTALDKEKGYDATFWQSDVLVTDISAIIIEYFVTGKPIIFCETLPLTCTYLDFFEKILSVCYIARNENELTEYLDRLQKGDDPLKQARQEMIRALFGEDLTATATAIAEDLFRDHFGK